MAITRAEVLKIAALANLQFSEPELEDFTAQFQHILNYIEKLKEVAGRWRCPDEPRCAGWSMLRYPFFVRMRRIPPCLQRRLS